VNAPIDIAAVKAAYRLEEVTARYGVKLRREGKEFIGLSPFKHERTPSFYVHPAKQVFKCFSSGEGGDVIKFVQLMEGWNFRETLHALASKAGIAGDARAAELAEERRAEQRRIEAEERREKNRRIRKAIEIWKACRPAEGTLAERYLRARCINLDAIKRAYGYKIPASLRFHPSLEYYYAGVRHTGPAMVGALTDSRRCFSGIHRTWLEATGARKADVPKPKLTLGVVWGSLGLMSAIASQAIVGEGYETTFSVMSEMARQRQAAFFASGLSLGNICGGGQSAIPAPDRAGALMPRGVGRLIILGDADGKDPAKTREMLDNAALKFRQLQGIETRIAMAEPGKDFNDMVRSAAA
jgi:DNA primase